MRRKRPSKTIQRIASQDMTANNETFHRYLTEGVPVYKRVAGGEERGDRVWLIDFNNPDNNEFVVANQFTVVENGSNKRPDIILFVNGIPLVVIELKNAVDENATIRSAFRQIDTYKDIHPFAFYLQRLCGHFRRTGSQRGFNLGGLQPVYGLENSRRQRGSLPPVSQLETLIRVCSTSIPCSI